MVIALLVSKILRKMLTDRAKFLNLLGILLLVIEIGIFVSFK